MIDWLVFNAMEAVNQGTIWYGQCNRDSSIFICDIFCVAYKNVIKSKWCNLLLFIYIFHCIMSECIFVQKKMVLNYLLNEIK